MAALVKGLKLAKFISHRSPPILYTITRNHWNKDFKPDSYPTTEEQRKCAAKKYNLLPEEYRPYADDGLGFGDYPNLPIGYGIEAKDPYYPYDFPENKRNFNEPIHAEIDLFGEDRYSQPAKPRYTTTYTWTAFLGVMAACFAVFYWLNDKKMFRPVIPKQYPGQGKTHYTFEPLD